MFWNLELNNQRNFGASILTYFITTVLSAHVCIEMQYLNIALPFEINKCFVPEQLERYLCRFKKLEKTPLLYYLDDQKIRKTLCCDNQTENHFWYGKI